MPSMFFPEIEELRKSQPVLAEAFQRLVSLVAPTAVTTSGKGNPNNVIYGTVNTVFVQTDDTTGSPQWIKTGKSGTNTGWVKLATSANQISGESPANPTGDRKTYQLVNAPVANTIQVYVAGARVAVQIASVVSKRVTFASPLPSGTVVIDYVKVPST